MMPMLIGKCLVKEVLFAADREELNEILGRASVDLAASSVFPAVVTTGSFAEPLITELPGRDRDLLTAACSARFGTDL
jgi:hypothetical protein